MFQFKHHHFVPALNVKRFRNIRVGLLSFTLIELLMVITIICLLVALLAPALKSAKERANSVKCMSNLRQIGIAIGLYGSDTSYYPENCDAHGAGGYNTFSTFSFTLSPYLGKPGTDWDSRSPVFECPSVIKTGLAKVNCHYSIHPFAGEVRESWGTGPYWKGPRPYPIMTRNSELILMADGSPLGEFMNGDAHYIFTWSPFYDQYDSTFADIPSEISSEMDPNEDYPIGLWGVIRYRHIGISYANILFFDNHVESVKNGKVLLRNMQFDSMNAQ